MIWSVVTIMKKIDRQVKNEVFANVCCCIDDYELSTKIYYQCKFLRLLLHSWQTSVVRFYFGSMFNQDNLQIMISTTASRQDSWNSLRIILQSSLKALTWIKAVENLGFIRSRLRETIVIDDDLVSIDTEWRGSRNWPIFSPSNNGVIWIWYVVTRIDWEGW